MTLVSLGVCPPPLGFCSLTCLENRGCNFTSRALGWAETAWVPRMSWDTESPSPLPSPGGAQHSHLTSSEMVLLGRDGVWLGTMACRERMTHQLCSEAWVVMAVVLAGSGQVVLRPGNFLFSSEQICCLGPSPSKRQKPQPALISKVGKNFVLKCGRALRNHSARLQ